LTFIISPPITDYCAQQSEVRFDDLTAEQLLNLEKGYADIAFRATQAPSGDTLIARRLHSVCWSL
jgi:DNA-binding transcriptional LysR family regulator